MRKDIRWKQRYEDLAKAFNLFTEAVSANHKLNVLEQEGLVKRYEFTFELAWKTMNDYLEKEGLTETDSPRDVINTAFKAGYIAEQQKWIDMLIASDNISHQYDKTTLKVLVNQITNEFYQEIRQLVFFLKGKL